MHTIKKIGNLISIIIIGILGLYIILMFTVPEKLNEFIGYRFCNILTGSMEPIIPTNSLVLVKILEEDEFIEQDAIITFQAERFKEPVLITHYFDHIEELNGEPYYRTHAYGVEQLDDFKTTREDIVGTYVFHIPYVGNLILFLKSPNAFVMYVMYSVIFLLYNLVLSYLDKKQIE